MIDPHPDLPSPRLLHRAGMPGRLAAAIIGLQAVVGVVFALLSLVVVPKDTSLSETSHVMLSVVTAALAIALGLVAVGLWRGRGWSRTAAVVWLLLLLPVGWALVQAGRGQVGALILGSAAIGVGAVAAESRDVARR